MKQTYYVHEGKKYYNIKQAFDLHILLCTPTPHNYQFYYRKFKAWMKKMEVQPIRIDGRTAYPEKSVKAFCDYWNLFL